ncbi:hypothetical protein ACFLVS_06870 [Chloroflexota bacterium]
MIQDTEVEDEEIQYSDIEEEDAVAEIPKEVRVLQTQAYDKSVSDLISMMKYGDILLDPDYQRNYML